MTRTSILSTAALLALAACGSSESAKDAANDAGTAATETAADAGTAIENTTADAANAVTPTADANNTADANTAAGYATNAALSDMFEIESSKLALEKTKSPKVRDYAQMMIKEHTATTDQLKSTLPKAGVTMTPPTALDQRRQEMLTELRNASAEDFDTKYLDLQTTAHQEALDLHQGFAQNGDNPQLKQLASTIAPKVQQHLDMAKKLDENGADDAAAKSKDAAKAK